MLTILHRQPDGSEAIFSANRIEALQLDGAQCVPVIGSRFRVWSDEDEGVGGCFEISIAYPFGAVFVMNKHGSTVARYLASPPMGDCSADPEKLAA